MTLQERLPDLVVIGKAIGGGIPTGAYGLSHALAERILARTDLDLVDMGGVGGTLAGNPLSVAAMRATLGEVLTEDAFATMIDTATTFTTGVQKLFDARPAVVDQPARRPRRVPLRVVALPAHWHRRRRGRRR